jgi:hypothetical protein
MKSEIETMRSILTSNSKPFRCTLCSLLLCIAGLWAIPANAVQPLYVASPDSRVGVYNAATGAAINPDLITEVPGPISLALSGNNLFVGNSCDGCTVGEFNASTGKAIQPNFIMGLDDPDALALSGNSLFVATSGGNMIGQYNASTGSAIKTDFITGLGAPNALALSANAIFVANYDSNTIGKYNATTGAAIKADFITGLRDPVALALSGNNLFVANGIGGTVGEYNAGTGAGIKTHFITGLADIESLALSGNILFVGLAANTIGEYNATTGATINADFIKLPNSPLAMVVGSYPPCSLQDTLAYDTSTGTLTINFTVVNTGYPDATWNAWLTYQNSIEFLFSESQPIVGLPKAVTKTKTDLDKEGEVGVLSTLTTPANGIVCSSFVETNTGAP